MQHYIGTGCKHIYQKSRNPPAVRNTVLPYSLERLKRAIDAGARAPRRGGRAAPLQGRPGGGLDSRRVGSGPDWTGLGSGRAILPEKADCQSLRISERNNRYFNL